MDRPLIILIAYLIQEVLFQIKCQQIVKFVCSLLNQFLS